MYLMLTEKKTYSLDSTLSGLRLEIYCMKLEKLIDDSMTPSTENIETLLTKIDFDPEKSQSQHMGVSTEIKVTTSLSKEWVDKINEVIVEKIAPYAKEKWNKVTEPFTVFPSP